MGKVKYWAKRIRVRAKRLAQFEAKYRYWKARWRRLRKQGAPKEARAESARMVRYYADLIDGTADLLEKAKKQHHRALTDAEEAREKREGQMSPHFHVSEFRTHDGTPVPRMAYEGLRHLCVNYLEPMRDKFGPAHVTSGHRHRAYNASIGGATDSFHIYDHPARRGDQVAADMDFARGTPSEWADEARRIANQLGRGGVGQYNRSGFVHMDNGPRRDWSG